MPGSGWIRISIVIAALLSLAAAGLQSGTWDVNSARLTISLSSVVTVALLLYDRLLWRLPLLRSLPPRPVIHGTWKAELRTSFADRAEEVIECYLIIRQTYSTARADMVFEHSRSYFLSGGIVEEQGRAHLSYLFRTEADSLHQTDNPPSRGAAYLVIARQPILHLEGDYWMERGTKGTIRTIGHSGALLESFAAARGAFR